MKTIFCLLLMVSTGALANSVSVEPVSQWRMDIALTERPGLAENHVEIDGSAKMIKRQIGGFMPICHVGDIKSFQNAGGSIRIGKDENGVFEARYLNGKKCEMMYYAGQDKPELVSSIWLNADEQPVLKHEFKNGVQVRYTYYYQNGHKKLEQVLEEPGYNNVLAYDSEGQLKSKYKLNAEGYLVGNIQVYDPQTGELKKEVSSVGNLSDEDTSFPFPPFNVDLL